MNTSVAAKQGTMLAAKIIYKDVFLIPVDSARLGSSSLRTNAWVMESNQALVCGPGGEVRSGITTTSETGMRNLFIKSIMLLKKKLEFYPFKCFTNRLTKYLSCLRLCSSLTSAKQKTRNFELAQFERVVNM